jgi:hypothetical protein
MSDDFMTFVHTVFNGAIIKCSMLDHRLPRGPLPYECSNGESSWVGHYSPYPDAEGNVGALLLYQDLIWYRRCDEDAS